MELKNLYLFEWLSDEEISYFRLIMWVHEFKAWETIISEWDKSNNLAYIIESWLVDVFRNWERVASLWEWELFWEIALITNEPRTATVVTNKDSKVFSFLKNDFLFLYERSGKINEIKEKILNRIKDNFYWIRK